MVVIGLVAWFQRYCREKEVYGNVSRIARYHSILFAKMETVAINSPGIALK